MSFETFLGSILGRRPGGLSEDCKPIECITVGERLHPERHCIIVTFYERNSDGFFFLFSFIRFSAEAVVAEVETVVPQKKPRWKNRKKKKWKLEVVVVTSSEVVMVVVVITREIAPFPCRSLYSIHFSVLRIVRRWVSSG